MTALNLAQPMEQQTVLMTALNLAQQMVRRMDMNWENWMVLLKALSKGQNLASRWMMSFDGPPDPTGRNGVPSRQSIQAAASVCPSRMRLVHSHQDYILEAPRGGRLYE
jgi:hypothetical protein